MTREELVNLLKESIVTITFLKKDGTKRAMKATLQDSFIPTLKGSNHKRNNDVIPVIDTEINQWRSFRLDSILKVETGD